MRWLSLMAANARLRQDNLRLLVALRTSNETTERVARRCALLERDIALVALMAKDRDVAVGFIQTAHDIDRQDETT